jgi:hypothetical protein
MRMGRADDAMRHARPLAALTLRFGMPEDLGTLPSAAVAGFEAYIQARMEKQQTVSERGGRTTRIRPYLENPRQPAVMAAVAPVVVSALAASNAREAGEQLDWLVRRMRDAGLPPSTGSRYGLTDELANTLAAQARARLPLWSNERPNGLHGVRRGAPAGERTSFDRVRVEHLPQVLWREAYEPLYRDLLPSKQQLPVRSFLSVLAAKTLLQGTWVQAAQALGVDYVDGRRIANSYTCRTVRNGSDAAVRHATHVLLQLLDEQPTLINYAPRRARFAALTDIEDAAWQAMADAAGVHPGLGARRRNAAVWVWSELTGGPFFRDPAAAGAAHKPSVMTRGRGRKDASFWTVFSVFYRLQLPKLRPHLSAYAQGLVGEEPLRPFVEGDVTRAVMTHEARRLAPDVAFAG